MPVSKEESEEIKVLLDGKNNDSAWFSKTTNGKNDFRYADGSTVSFNGWAEGYPKQRAGKISCGYIVRVGGWYEGPMCRKRRATICQRYHHM